MIKEKQVGMRFDPALCSVDLISGFLDGRLEPPSPGDYRVNFLVVRYVLITEDDHMIPKNNLLEKCLDLITYLQQKKEEELNVWEMPRQLEIWKKWKQELIQVII